MWPEKNTAFVVIHGAGSHRPFEALDRFLRGFRKVLLNSNPDLDAWWRHTLQRHEDWVENYVSLAPEGKPKLDFYEYYWDLYVDHEIDLREVIKWLGQVSDSAKRFYHGRPELAREHEQKGVDLFKDGDFKAGGYFVPLGGVGRFLRLLQRIGLARIPVLSTVVRLSLNRASQFMAEMMGDVVIYTGADVRSKSYAVRQNVLKGAVEELLLLLQREDYEQIIVVGHSLGSLIAYDAINRIIRDVNAAGGLRLEQAQKLAGLVTFGSPLDKVAFFFREHIPDEAYMRRQILTQLHGFKSHPWPGDQKVVNLNSPMQRRMENMRWLNFYHLQDPVSGHLDAYDVDRNILCEAKVGGAAEAHRLYWSYDPLYEEIGAEFFGSRSEDRAVA
jgi:hypothetical protein